jgi:alginate O-acetyltransferase complex protein AlgI
VVSYLIDVYRRDVQAQKSILKMGVYKSFFPQLIAGPIVRYKEISGELSNRTVTVSDLSYGLRRFVWGLALKVLIANSMGSLADQIYGAPTEHLTPLLAWTAAIAYYFQIFYDFSGYSHMAIGLARMFGFHFPENFNSPYISRSISEFWTRWHITLSHWMRDYIYIPLGGNRTSSSRQTINVLITMLVSGFWHGAAFTFIAWGLFHGLLMALEKYFLLKIYKKLPSFISLMTTTFFVVIGWVIFRSNSMAHASSIFTLLLGFKKGNPLWLPMSSLINREVIITFVFALLLIRKNWFEKLILHDDDSIELNRIKQFVLLFSVVFLLIISLSFLASNTFNPFIYYRF